MQFPSSGSQTCSRKIKLHFHISSPCLPERLLLHQKPNTVHLLGITTYILHSKPRRCCANLRCNLMVTAGKQGSVADTFKSVYILKTHVSVWLLLLIPHLRLLFLALSPGISSTPMKERNVLHYFCPAIRVAPKYPANFLTEEESTLANSDILCSFLSSWRLRYCNQSVTSSK